MTHPNVCRVFDLFRHKSESSSEETVFVSMELLYGSTLSTRLKKEGRMGMAEALPLVSQMASGLGAALLWALCIVTSSPVTWFLFRGT